MSFPSVLARLSLVGAILGAAPAALAARIAVLVPAIDSSAKFTDGKRNKFHDTLTKGLADEAGVSNTVISAEEVRQKLGLHTLLSECQSGPCLSQVATKLSADRLIVAHVGVKNAIGGSAYTVELAVFDQAGTALGITGSEKCGDDSDGCNLAKAYESLRRASANIAGQLLTEKAPPPRPVERPTPPPPPPPQDLQLKDPSIGESPPGPIPQTPPPPPPPTVSRTSGPRPYRIGWITSLIAGGVLIIPSIPFFYFASQEGQTNCGPTVPRNQCPQVYQGNLGPALGLLIGDLVLAGGTFAAFYYLDQRQLRQQRGVALLPVPLTGGAALSAVGRF